MTLKQYLFLMFLGDAICWAGWFFVILNIDPKNAGLTGMLFFYISLFLAIVGLFSVFGFLIKQKFAKDDNIIFRHVKRTFRQGVVFSSFIILTLILLQNNLLTWWNFLLLAILLFVIEGIIFANRKYNNHSYV